MVTELWDDVLEVPFWLVWVFLVQTDLLLEELVMVIELEFV